MFLMIDNYDSFVYNLKAYFEELGREIMVRRSDQINIEEIEKMQPEGIILSPGPKRPWDAVRCVETVKRFQGKIPILGVCLGHQVLGHCCGAVVEKGSRPMHGKVTEIRNNRTGLFERLPDVLDAKLLASALSISKAGAYQLLNRPDFPTLQVGGRKLVTKQKLALWMEQHTNTAEQAGAGKEKKADETDKV